MQLRMLLITQLAPTTDGSMVHRVLTCALLTYREPLLFVIALCESYRVNVGWENPVGGSAFNTLYDDYAPGELGM